MAWTRRDYEEKIEACKRDVEEYERKARTGHTNEIRQANAENARYYTVDVQHWEGKLKSFLAEQAKIKCTNPHLEMDL